MDAKSTTASTYAKPDNRPRHVNPQMDLELKNYTFPRVLPKQSEPAVSSKDVLQKLLLKYQQTTLK